VVVAALIAGKLPSEKDTWAKFNQSALHAISVLFQIGFQGSLAFPQTSLAPKLTGITAENEGIPTPMLAVTGLGLDHLQKAIDSISAHLAVDLPLNHPNDAQVSLFNGPKAFVVTGHPRTLVGLVSALRKSKAEPGLDQSKVSAYFCIIKFYPNGKNESFLKPSPFNSHFFLLKKRFHSVNDSQFSR
jgi:hypothetical protein